MNPSANERIISVVLTETKPAAHDIMYVVSRVIIFGRVNIFTHSFLLFTTRAIICGSKQTTNLAAMIYPIKGSID